MTAGAFAFFKDPSALQYRVQLILPGIAPAVADPLPDSDTFSVQTTWIGGELWLVIATAVNDYGDEV